MDDPSQKESRAVPAWEAAFIVKHPTRIAPYEGFPPILDRLTIILGEGDTIGLWYLPGALAHNVQVSIRPVVVALFLFLSKGTNVGFTGSPSGYFTQKHCSMKLVDNTGVL